MKHNGLAQTTEAGSLAHLRWYQLIYLRRSPALALVAALALTFGLVFVTSGSPSPHDPGNPELTSAIADPTTTTLDLEVSDDEIKALVLSAPEVRLTQEAATSTTTSSTSSTTSTTSTTVAPQPQQQTKAKTKPQPSTTTTTAPAPSTNSGFRSDYESDFRSRINSVRSSNGLSSLSSEGSLNARARDWAKQMAANGGLSHSNISSLVPPWSAAGENVGLGGSVGSIFNSLAGSSGHLQNMLSDAFTHVGVGVWVDESGRLWTAHVFAG